MVSARFFQHVRWRTLLLQPTWIAGAISVGVHGVLFAAGPTFSNLNLDTLADPDALADARRVPLVELTLEEQQQHLPDFSNSFYSLSSLEDFDPLAPNPVPFLPQDNSTTAGRPPRPRTTITEQITLGTTPYRSRLPAVPFPPQGTTERNRPAAETPSPDGAAASTPEGTTTSPPAETPAETRIAPEASTPTTTEPSAQDLVRVPSNPAEGTSGNAAGQRPNNPPLLFAYNSDTLEEAWERWLAQSELSLDQQPLPSETLPLPYIPSQAACPNPEQYGLLAALVNAEGKLVGESVQLLKSTGNEALDTWAATEGVDAFKFPEDSKEETTYLLEVFVARAESCD